MNPCQKNNFSYHTIFFSCYLTFFTCTTTRLLALPGYFIEGAGELQQKLSSANLPPHSLRKPSKDYNNREANSTASEEPFFEALNAFLRWVLQKWLLKKRYLLPLKILKNYVIFEQKMGRTSDNESPISKLVPVWKLKKKKLFLKQISTPNILGHTFFYVSSITECILECQKKDYFFFL